MVGGVKGDKGGGDATTRAVSGDLLVRHRSLISSMPPSGQATAARKDEVSGWLTSTAQGQRQQ